MKRVLLIDDDPVITSIYRNLLRAKRWEVDVADNGDAGYQAVLRRLPDLILLDLDMPVLTGLQFLRRLRKIPRFQSIPVVVFTGSGLRSRVLAAWEAGAALVLYKVRDKPHHVLDALRKAPACRELGI